MFVADLFKSRSRLLKLGASFSCFNSTVFDQRLTNDTPQPNRNKRRQTSSNATLIIKFFRVLRGGRTAHNGLVAPVPWCVAGLENGPSRTEQAGAVNWLTNCTLLAS